MEKPARAKFRQHLGGHAWGSGLCFKRKERSWQVLSKGWNQNRWETRELYHIEYMRYPEQRVHAMVKIKVLEHASLRVDVFLSK